MSAASEMYDRLSHHALDLLKAAGIDTAAKLIAASAGALLKIPGMGPDTFREVTAVRDYLATLPATSSAPVRLDVNLRDFLAAHIAGGDTHELPNRMRSDAMLSRARLYYRLADAMLIARDE